MCGAIKPKPYTTHTPASGGTRTTCSRSEILECARSCCARVVSCVSVVLANKSSDMKRKSVLDVYIDEDGVENDDQYVGVTVLIACMR